MPTTTIIQSTALITLGAAESLGKVIDTPADAFVVSASASYIFKALGKGFGGMGLEGTYDFMYSAWCAGVFFRIRTTTL